MRIGNACWTSGEDAMAKQRYQDPKILTRADVSRPFFYILAAVPVVTAEG